MHLKVTCSAAALDRLSFPTAHNQQAETITQFTAKAEPGTRSTPDWHGSWRGITA